MKKIWKYPDEMTDFVAKHGHEGSIDEMRQRVLDRFGLDLSYMQMKTFFSNHKIHAAPQKGRKRPESSKYPNDMEDFIRSIAQGKSSQELTDAVNAKYGEGTITVAHMKAYKKNHGINTGLTGRFEKGHVSHNKGLKQTDFMTPEAIERTKATRFQKGQIPHNGGTPIGTIRRREATKGKAGSHPYYWEKVAEPNVWKIKHVLVWEEHNGPVPDGCMVTFANGDTLDYRIENLILETKAQHGIKNRHHIHGYDQESSQVANMIADLKMAQTKAKKRRKKCRSASETRSTTSGAARTD